MLGGIFRFVILFIVIYIIYSLIVNAIGIYRKIRREQAEMRSRTEKAKKRDKVIELDKDQYKVE
ncbi:MAG: hypothetical protein EPN93_17950 [Spirochaetes bacterium]|nr:MAG: hypothetical protein EPN93_17950 [Spirochaetota bacterium]